MVDWILAHYMDVLIVLSAVIAGASVICKALAPLTKSTVDDRAAGWLDRAHGWLSVIALNPKDPKSGPKPDWLD